MPASATLGDVEIFRYCSYEFKTMNMPSIYLVSNIPAPSFANAKSIRLPSFQVTRVEPSWRQDSSTYRTEGQQDEFHPWRAQSRLCAGLKLEQDDSLVGLNMQSE